MKALLCRLDRRQPQEKVWAQERDSATYAVGNIGTRKQQFQYLQWVSLLAETRQHQSQIFVHYCRDWRHHVRQCKSSRQFSSHSPISPPRPWWFHCPVWSSKGSGNPLHCLALNLRVSSLGSSVDNINLDDLHFTITSLSGDPRGFKHLSCPQAFGLQSSLWRVKLAYITFTLYSSLRGTHSSFSNS